MELGGTVIYPLYLQLGMSRMELHCGALRSETEAICKSLDLVAQTLSVWLGVAFLCADVGQQD